MFLRLFRVVFFYIFAIEASAQNLQVQNVRFEQKNEQIIVRYDLNGQPGKKYTVSLALSYDNGNTFSIKPVSLNGDVGKNVIHGKDKSIVWNMIQDFPKGIEGDGVVFTVNAKLQKSAKKWPYLLGAAVVGGATVFLTQSGGSEDKNDKGSVTIQVPGDI